MIATGAKALFATQGDSSRIQQIAEILPSGRGVEAFQTLVKKKIIKIYWYILFLPVAS
jgi:hypothetical protein